MQFIVVTIRVNTRPDGPKMRYPSVYNAKQVELNKEGPILYDGGIGRGEATEECMIHVQDALATSYASHPDIRIVNEAAANSWINDNPVMQEAPVERVTDIDRMFAILAKNAAGQALSAEDLAALDPDNTMRGINSKPKTARGYFNNVK